MFALGAELPMFAQGADLTQIHAPLIAPKGQPPTLEVINEPSLPPHTPLGVAGLGGGGMLQGSSSLVVAIGAPY